MADAPRHPEQPAEPGALVPAEQTPGLPPSPLAPPQPAGAPRPTSPAHRSQSRQFAFDGGAGTYIGTGLLAFFITVLTLGICYPFAYVLRERWRAKHSYIDGRQLVFVGSGLGLFAMWLKWFVLIIITIGIYAFWVGPRLYRWKWENTSWAPSVTGDELVAARTP
jgi:uncharacterized membrane protein YjgN (DUF898 family)